MSENETETFVRVCDLMFSHTPTISAGVIVGCYTCYVSFWGKGSLMFPNGWDKFVEHLEEVSASGLHRQASLQDSKVE